MSAVQIPKLSIFDVVQEIYNHTDDQGNQQAAVLVHNKKHFAWQANPAVWRSSGLPQIDTLAACSFARFHYYDQLQYILNSLEEHCRFHPGQDAELTWKAIDMGNLKTYQYSAKGRLILVDDNPCRLMKMIDKVCLS